MKLLIYGAGVIGCLYAALFSKAGYNITIYARGKRLESLEKEGLLYWNGDEIHSANVTIINKLHKNDTYDYIFLTVRENQLHQALVELKDNNSPNIVTMVNSLEKYAIWEELCGKGRIIPAFPGAGGSFEGNVLNATLTPWIVQPTTFAEISGKNTKRLQKLAAIFRKSKIPYQIVKDMHAWQLCHLAMVIPIADAYYEADDPKNAGKNFKLMSKTAKRMKRNYRILHRIGYTLSPKKMNLFRLVPDSILSIALSIIFQSNFGNMFMYQHSMKAQDEMRELHQQFYRYIKKQKSEYKKMELVMKKLI